MEALSINNYEAYYLDFLEGNLNEADIAVLLDFLDKHPELKLEEEEFASLENNSITLDNSYKQSLKQVLFDEDFISNLNINSFLIAQTEGQLSPAKEEELEKFIAVNPVYLKEQKLFQASHLKANLEEVYTEKSSLKKARVFPLRTFFGVTAAASVALFIYLGNFNSTDPTQFAQKDPVKTNIDSIVKIIPIKDALVKHTIVEGVKNQLVVGESAPLVATINTEKDHLSVPIKEQEPLKENIQVNTLVSIKIKQFELKEEFSEPKLASNHVKPTVAKYRENESDYTTLGFNQMNNPILPITYKLSKMVKKDIDFRTAKPTSKHSGGFYFKIGKFIISRTKS